MLKKINNKLQLQLENYPELNPICVDFLEGQLAHRREYGGGKNQSIAKAVGVRPRRGQTPTILDISGGLARDAFVFAYLGADVTAIERNPMIAALVKDAFERAKKEEWFRKLKFKFIEVDAKTYLNEWIASSRVTFVRGPRNDGKKDTPDHERKDNTTSDDRRENNSPDNDETPPPSLPEESEAFIDAIHPQPDVIYFDPMFPERTKSALVKKEMRILKEVVGDDTDADEIFKLALTKAKKRVVVKRPKGAPHLNNQEPSLIYKGKSSRFDVYFVKRGQTPKRV